MSYVDGSRTKGGYGYHQKGHFKQMILERDNHTCQICGSPAQEVDHIIPWRISHDSTPSNLRAICIKCNRARRQYRKGHALPWVEWCRWLDDELAKCLA